MKTIKIKDETHNRLTLFKNILKKRTLDEAIDQALILAADNLFEYDKDFSDTEYRMITNDK